MKREDWFATPFDTNVGEAGHRIANLHGTRLSLLAAIETGNKINRTALERIGIITTTGSSSRYTSQSAMVRFAANTVRRDQRRDAHSRLNRACNAERIEEEHQEQLRHEFRDIATRTRNSANRGTLNDDHCIVSCT
jgi:hypothetical protein